MPSAYKISIHAGTSTNAFVATAFADGANPLKSAYLQYNVWDNFVYVQWLTVDGVTYSASVELDPNWQPILIPFAALGFRIMSKVAGLHGRYQIIAMA